MLKAKHLIQGVVFALFFFFTGITPIEVQAADRFGGGNIVIDPENQDEGKPEYMPQAYISYYNGLKDKVERYTYDKDGNITKVKSIKYNYQYDNNLQPIKNKYTISKDEYYYKYKDGRMISRVEKSNGRIVRVERLKYKNGRLNTIETKDIRRGLREFSDWGYFRIKYKYNKNGRLKVRNTYELEWNENTGNYVPGWGPNDSETYYYDKKGRLLKYDGEYDGGSSYIEEYKYDKKGNYTYKYYMDDDDGWSEPRETKEIIKNKYNKIGILYKSISIFTSNDPGYYFDDELDDDLSSRKNVKVISKVYYDEYGNAVKEISDRYDEDTLVRQSSIKYKNVYNTDGKLLSSVGRRTVLEGTEKGTEKVCYVDKYTYDDKGNILYHKYKKAGEASRVQRFKYYKKIGKD